MQKLKTLKILLASLAAIALIAVGCESKPNTLERPVDNSQQNSDNPESSQGQNDGGEVAGEVAPLETKKITVANQEVRLKLPTPTNPVRLACPTAQTWTKVPDCYLTLQTPVLKNQAFG